MRKLFVFAAVVMHCSLAHAQTTATNCTPYGWSVRCTSTTVPSFDWSAWVKQGDEDRANSITAQQLELERQQMEYQFRIQQQQLESERQQLNQQQQALAEAQEKARRAESRFVPEGVFLNSETQLGDGTKRCSFNNGAKRVIASTADCWTK